MSATTKAHQKLLNDWTDKFLVGVGHIAEDGHVGRRTNERVLAVKYYLGYDKRNADFTPQLEKQMAHPHTVKYFHTKGGMLKGIARRTKQRARHFRGATKVSTKTVGVIAGYEGFRSAPYRDAVGVWTIGYGHTHGVGPGSRHLSQPEAFALLRSEVNEFAKGVTKLLKRKPSQGEFDALVSFAYNVGLGALRDSTLLRKYNAGDKQGAANEFLRWDKAGGRALPGLTRRRREERALFLS